MSWKDEIRKKDDLEKRYEIAYHNFESESRSFFVVERCNEYGLPQQCY